MSVATDRTKIQHMNIYIFHPRVRESVRRFPLAVKSEAINQSWEAIISGADDLKHVSPVSLAGREPISDPAASVVSCWSLSTSTGARGTPAASL